MTESPDIERRYASIRMNPRERRGERYPHKRLLLAWSIARCLRGLERLIPFDLAEPDIIALLDAFGPHSENRRGASFPFWHLRNDDGIWEIDSQNRELLDKRQPTPRQLRAFGVRAGLSADDYERFRANPATAWRIATRLIGDHFPESMRDTVLSAAGFDAVAPPDEAVVAVKPPDLRLRRRALEIYGARCAVCGFGLTTSGLPTALDAALIRWRSHGGPSDPRNCVCLCAVHRAAFDAGGFTIEPRDGGRLVAVVSSAVSGASLAAFRRHDREPLAVPSALPPDLRPDESHLLWHNREVFRTPGDLPSA